MPGKSYLFYKFSQPFYLKPHPRDGRLSINSPLLGALIFTTVKRNKMKYTYQLYLDQTHEPASIFGFTGHFSGHWASSHDFFFLKFFLVWGLRLLALYRRSPAVMPAESIRSMPRDSRHTGSSHSSKAGGRQGRREGLEPGYLTGDLSSGKQCTGAQKCTWSHQFHSGAEVRPMASRCQCISQQQQNSLY